MDQTQPSDRRPTVFITGTSSGIGQAAVATVLQAGWNVAVHYRQSAQDAQQTAADCRAAGMQALAFAADLRDEAQTRALVPESPE